MVKRAIEPHSALIQWSLIYDIFSCRRKVVIRKLTCLVICSITYQVMSITRQCEQIPACASCQKLVFQAIMLGKPLTLMTGKSDATFERVTLVVRILQLYSVYQNSVNGNLELFVEYLLVRANQ